MTPLDSLLDPRLARSPIVRLRLRSNLVDPGPSPPSHTKPVRLRNRLPHRSLLVFRLRPPAAACSPAVLRLPSFPEDPSSASEPPPPIDGAYQLFGATYITDVVLPSLEDQGVRQLYPKGPDIDFKEELRTLNRELQLHILELADILVERPSQYARRVEDISLIFKNLHHLLNSLRPHQARATLIHLLENQIQRRKQAIENIKQRRKEAQRLLGESLVIIDGSQQVMTPM